MALPSAQLGSLPSLNMPSYIPTTVVHKEPKAWEQALLSLLTSAAGAAAGKGVDNAMSQDYASEFGQTPSSGFSKLATGPKVNERQAIDLRGRAAEDKRLASSERTGKLDRMLQGTQMNQRAASDLNTQALAADTLSSNIERNRGNESIDLERLKAEQAHQHLQDLVSQINAERQGQLAGAQTTHLGAETKHLNTESAKTSLKNQMMQDALDAQTKKNAPAKPTDALKRFASAGGPPQTLGATTSSPDAQITSLLSSGISPDDIVAQLNAAQGRQSRTDTRASAYESADDAKAAATAAALAEIKRRVFGVDTDPIGAVY